MHLKEEPIIQVKNLSKQYMIGADTTYKTLSGSITDTLRSPLKYLKNYNKQNEIFWALKDINFEVNRGEVVGIIGRNGAGKSTLLKVLSRITHPTEGEIKLRGRVGSLLEVGTGFHPELTGRENVYFNGAILGMKKREIEEKFEEIVKFSGVEKFLDTPVKRYSSGMYVRLAFAVAAHMDPEILIVDEVLAVGDAAFQKKCLGKMSEVAEGGRTVLFVSHNMGAVKALCQKGILLEEGKISIADTIDNTINYYSGNTTGCEYYKASQESKSNNPYFKEITLIQDNHNKNVFSMNQPIRMKFVIENFEKHDFRIGVVIRNSQDLWVIHSSDEFSNNNFNRASSLRECEIPAYALAAGKYLIDVSLWQRNIEIFQSIPNALRFEIEFAGVASERTTGNEWKGVCGPGLLKWIS